MMSGSDISFFVRKASVAVGALPSSSSSPSSSAILRCTSFFNTSRSLSLSESESEDEDDSDEDDSEAELEISSLEEC